MANTRYDLEEELREQLSNAERVVVAGIGNPIRMDDFVGVKVVRDLQGKVSERVCLIECEAVPESFTQQIIDCKPTHILLVDAAVLGLRPGDSRLIDPRQLATSPAVSTHALPLRIFCEYLVETTKARIGLLLIEPGKADFGEGLTPEVKVSAKKIVNALLRVLP